MLEALDKPDGAVLRLEPDREATGIALLVGEPQVSDEVVERDGADVLHVADSVSRKLDGAVIDVIDSSSGPRLQVRRKASRED
ncbi:MAG: hypothetical protein E6I76_03730 [Chloroflexi bacterium]|nr:MAG: hypothetical protein E6I76_03730 [Chloroflexota bacterium]